MNTIFIRSAHEIIRVELSEIEYIESVENYIRIHFTNGKSLMSLMPLKKILEKLPDKFVRIHRRFIVNADKVKKIGWKKVWLSSVELRTTPCVKKLKTLLWIGVL